MSDFSEKIESEFYLECRECNQSEGKLELFDGVISITCTNEYCNNSIEGQYDLEGLI